MSSTEADERYRIVVKREILDLNEGVNFVQSPRCGAISTFSGTIRDTDRIIKGESCHFFGISSIYFEAYESMAIKQISNIVEKFLTPSQTDSQNTYGSEVDLNAKVFVAIRLGIVPVGESSILICVSSTGRHFSHNVTMEILRRVKSEATIWKKIIFKNGSEAWDVIEKSEAKWLTQHEHEKTVTLINNRT